MRASFLLLCCCASGLAAQNVPCRGQRIDTIVIDAQAPTVTGLRRVPIVGDVVRGTHVVTRGDIIKGFLVLKVGDRCTELRRAESERILRAQPFIADANIEVVPSANGSVTLEVHTIDEASTILGGSVGATSPAVRSVRVGSSNLAGLGITTTFGWKHEGFYDDQLQVRLMDHQFAGRPWVVDLASSRYAVGREDRAQISLPFRTDLQRVAWRALIGESRNHAQFIARDTGRLALGFERQYGEAGGMLRIGPPGQLGLVGLSVTNERSFSDTNATRITDFGFRTDTGAALAGQFVETHVARVNALFGLRYLRFMRARAIDALRGIQDIPMGVQFGTLVGRGVPIFGANTTDLFVAPDLYIGLGTPREVYRLQVQGEGRHVDGISDWQGLVGSGRLSRHARVSDRRTRIFALEWSGTLRAEIPHSLTLNAREGGVRGFSESTEFGGRRGVIRIDEQIYLGAPQQFGDLGVAFFADAGRLWPGDIPYATRSELRGSAGVSLLLAIPMRSTRTWRLEFAAPFNPEPGGRKWEVRLSHADLTSFFWREPADVGSARARAVPASIYSWP